MLSSGNDVLVTGLLDDTSGFIGRVNAGQLSWTLNRYTSCPAIAFRGLNRYERLFKTVAHALIAHARPNAFSKNSNSKVDTQNDAHSETLYTGMNGQLESNIS